jgi:anti-sigma regulatory factor (Ser/Thr protein kinase)
MNSASWHTIDEFRVPSEPGGERDVVRRMAASIAELHMSADELDRLSTAVAETVMNAIEHGNHNDPRLDVDVTVRTDGQTVEVLVSDNGGLRALPENPEIPNLEAKLDGLQRPRGWGLFLVRSMVDAMDVVADPADPSRHTARLRLRTARPASEDGADPEMSEPEGTRHAQQM